MGGKEGPGGFLDTGSGRGPECVLEELAGVARVTGRI